MTPNTTPATWPHVTPYPVQVEAVDACVTALAECGSSLLVLPTGCHAPGTKVLASSGMPILVEHVGVGDQLLGMDGTTRTVVRCVSGVAPMATVHPLKGDSFTVTMDHTLTLVRTGEAANPTYSCERQAGKIVDVSVAEWLGWSTWRKHIHKLFRVRVDDFDWPRIGDPPVDAYMVGVFLGDGSLQRQPGVTTMDAEVRDAVHEFAESVGADVRCEPAGGAADTMYLAHGGRHGSGGTPTTHALRRAGIRGMRCDAKRIPERYRFGTRDERLQVLAGLVDTDGSASGGGYDFISKSENLSRDVAFVARSLGLAAYVQSCEKFDQNGGGGTYWRVGISGDCEMVPCRIPRKQHQSRKQKKNPLRTGFSIEPIGVGNYHGFTVDGDHRYLLDDFTVTHNCGKTVVFAELARRYVQRGEYVLVVAHTEELIEQAADKIQRFGGLSVGVEMAKRRVDTSGLYALPDVVVTSVQSMSRPSRLERYAPDTFGLVVIDEAHRSAATTYCRITNHFTGHLLGVTATPDRRDRKALSDVFASVAYTYEIRQAIEDEHLVPIRVLTSLLPDLDLTGIRMVAGDFNQSQLADAVAQGDVLREAAEVVAEHAADRQVLAFLPSVALAGAFAASLRDAGITAESLSGRSDRDHRREVIQAFRRSEFQALSGCLLFTEGFDVPAIDCVAILRPTTSRALYAQMLGRGTRLAEGKDDLLVLDFPANSTDHKLVNPLDVLGGDTRQDILERAQRMLEAAGGGDALDFLDGAAAEIEEEEARAKAIRAKRAAELEEMDPFGAAPTEPVWATELREKWRLKPHEIPTMEAEAMAYIRILNQRRAQGLCTWPQARLLKSKGLPTTEVEFEVAMHWIDGIAAAGWVVPAWVREEARRYE